MSPAGTRGPLPKPAEDRQRRGAATYEPVELGAAPVSGAPKLSTHARRKLHRETREWWDVVAGSPQASQFGPTDWQRLRMVVLPIVERFNRAVDPPKGRPEAPDADVVRLAKALADLEAEFGLTPASRLRLRWTVRAKGSGDADEKSAEKAPARRQARRGDPRGLALVKPSG